MKYIWISISLMLLSINWGLSQTTEHLIAYYPFSGNGNDSTSNEFHSTVNGATLTTDRFGNEMSAYYFDGLDDNIILPEDFDLPERTVLFWFQCDSFPVYDSTDHNNSIDIIYSSDHVFTEHGLTKIFVTQLDGVNSICYHNGGPNQFTNNCFAIEKGAWYSGAISVSPEKICYFLDGQFLKERAFPGNIHSTTDYGFYTSSLGVGRSLEIRFLEGKIDDVRIYDKKLSHAEIREIYTHDIALVDVNVEEIISSVIYPNPSVGELTIQLDEKYLSSISKVRIIDILGKLILEKPIKNQNSLKFDLHDYDLEGHFFLQLIDVNLEVVDLHKLVIIPSN